MCSEIGPTKNDFGMWVSCILFSLNLFPFRGHVNENEDGLHVYEAMQMVSLCNTFPFSNAGYPNVFVPFGYRSIHVTEETPLKNIVRVFKKNEALFLVFRGTVNNKNSWLENLHFFQIPAANSLWVDGKQFKYNFSRNTSAQVHSGYVLGIHFLREQLDSFIYEQLQAGVKKIVCTGHSQGGALAQLFMAQLDLNPDFSAVELINYSFGSPMIGNSAFAEDFDNRFVGGNKSFRFVNVDDFVCKLPVENKGLGVELFNRNTEIDFEQALAWIKLGLEFAPESYKSKIDLNTNAAKKIAKDLVSGLVGDVVFPEFDLNVFYGPTGNTILLDAEPYPDWLEQTSASVEGDSWTQFFFGYKSELSREWSFVQHHIFSYYNAIYKRYQPKGFRRVRLLVLPENLI